MKHLRYLRYVILHKLYVYQAGRQLGLGRLQLLIHDWQKFTPAEWFPYVEKFYGEKPIDRLGKQQLQEAFDRAWLHHQRVSGKHHWQYWLLEEDNGGQKCLKMPDRHMREMIADWRGAGRAITGTDDALPWYIKNRDKIRLHPDTRQVVEKFLGLSVSESKALATGKQIDLTHLGIGVEQ